MADKLGPIDDVVRRSGVSHSEIANGTKGVWVDYGMVFRSANGLQPNPEEPNWEKLATMETIERPGLLGRLKDLFGMG